MRKTNINGSTIYYLKKGDPVDLEPKEDYKTIFDYMESICKFLKIKCPDLALAGCLINKYDNSLMGGETYNPKEFPQLDNNLIILAMDNLTDEQIVGFLLHELRHVWQHVYYPDLDHEHAHGFIESLNHPAEIDADAFAIWFLSNLPSVNTIEHAAEIICPTEKASYPKAYKARITNAYQLRANFNKSTVT